MALLTWADIDEKLDSGRLDDRTLASALEFLAWTNRYFGGHRAILRRLEEFSRTWKPDSLITILDVGIGMGDMPVAIARWAQRRRLSVRIVGLEPDPAIAKVARAHTASLPEIKIVRAFIDDLVGRQRFDYVISNLVLHHVAPSEQPRFLHNCSAVARRGLIISDLSRSLPSWLAVKALTALFGDATTRQDGPASVRRSCTPRTLEDLVRRAGCPQLRVQQAPLFRLMASGPV